MRLEADARCEAGLLLDLLPTPFRRSQPNAAFADVARHTVHAESSVKRNAVHEHPRQTRRAAQLADKAGCVRSRAADKLTLLKNGDILAAKLGKMIGNA